MEVALSDIRTDPEFEAAVPSLTTEAFALLRDNIDCDGLRDPLVVWRREGGNDPLAAQPERPQWILLDGHHRLAACSELRIKSVPIVEMEFASRDDAIDFIVRNQIGRRNLTPWQAISVVYHARHAVISAARQRRLAGLRNVGNSLVVSDLRQRGSCRRSAGPLGVSVARRK